MIFLVAVFIILFLMAVAEEIRQENIKRKSVIKYADKYVPGWRNRLN